MNISQDAIEKAISHLQIEELDLTKAVHLTPTEVILMSVLHDSVRYAYEIIDLIPIKSDGRKLVKIGTVYPTLTLLKQKGLIVARRDQKSSNVLRAYYSLSELGKISLYSHLIDLLLLFNA